MFGQILKHMEAFVIIYKHNLLLSKGFDWKVEVLIKKLSVLIQH